MRRRMARLSGGTDGAEGLTGPTPPLQSGQLVVRRLLLTFENPDFLLSVTLRAKSELKNTQGLFWEKGPICGNHWNWI